MIMVVYRSINFTYISQPLVFENENAGIQDLKFHLFSQPLVFEKENAGVKELKFHLLKAASGA